LREVLIEYLPGGSYSEIHGNSLYIHEMIEKEKVHYKAISLDIIKGIQELMRTYKFFKN